MPRQRRSYYDENYRSSRSRQHRGCWYHLKNIGQTILAILAGMVVIGLISLAYTYRAYLQTVLLVIIGIASLILAVALLRWAVEMITSAFNAISAMRVRATQAKKAKVELSRRKLERDAYRQRLQQSQQPKRIEPLRPQVPTPLLSDKEPLVRRLQPVPEVPKSGIPGMPHSINIPYKTIAHKVKPGQLVALIRGNGTVRLETWNKFKMLLVLGSSSSGKSTTIAEKVLGFVNGGGAIVPCDPHEAKEDSLFKKIDPLASALYPGALFAVSHADILRNIRLVKAILQDRVDRGDPAIPVLLIVEELNRLLRDKAIAKEISLILETLAEEARGFNVFVILGCQRVTGLSDIRKAFISTIVHRCDETEARLVLPARFAKYCPELRPGQCFVKDSDGETEAGLQVLVTRQDIEQANVAFPRSRFFYEHLTTRFNPRQAPAPPVSTGQQATGHMPPRPVHKTRLEPAQREKEMPNHPLPNQHHTWPSQTPGSERPASFKRLSDFANKPPNHFPVPVRNTEELSPDHLSNSQQLEILALLRKKSQK